MTSQTRKRVVVLVFAVALYAVFLFTKDLNRLIAVLKNYALWTFGLALLLAFGNYLLRFLKWQFYLKRLDIGTHSQGQPFAPLPFGESFTIFTAGFVMSITPGKAGEVFRSALLSSSRGVAVARSAPIVVADRLTDLLALIVLVAVGSLAFPGFGWIAVVGLLFVSSILLVVFWRALAEFIFRVLSKLGPIARIVPKLREAYESLRMLSDPPALAFNTTVSIVAWTLECFALWVILYGLHHPVSLGVSSFAYATATIAGALAMLPGGLGATEFVMEKILSQQAHVPSPDDRAATLLVRFATLWFAVVVGAVALWIFRRRYDRPNNATPVSNTSTT